MSSWEFRDPWFLAAALLAPACYYLLVRRSPASVTYSTFVILRRAPRSIRARLAFTPAFLHALAVVAMAIALSGPRSGVAETRVRREGIAIMMIVDRSSSMNARDMVKDDTNVNRLDAVKSIFKQFVLGETDDDFVVADIGSGRPDDVIGLVAFARYADGLCPLTLDHGNLTSIVGDLSIVTQRSEDGTALGEGLALAVERLRKHPARSKVAILLTDGVNNAGNVTPQQAAELAVAHQVKVYCIGTGTRGVAPVPARDPFTGRIVFRPGRVQIDEETLKAIASRTEGHYFRATDAEGLADIYSRIDQLERTQIKELRYLQYHEWFGAFVWTALGLIVAGGLLGGSLFRRLP